MVHHSRGVFLFMTAIGILPSVGDVQIASLNGQEENESHIVQLCLRLVYNKFIRELVKHMGNERKVWLGEPPKVCDLCNTSFVRVFIDGRIIHGLAWAYMCESCHRSRGVGLGLGKGQKYQKTETTDTNAIVWENVE
jgi:hypothetical protein